MAQLKKAWMIFLIAKPENIKMQQAPIFSDWFDTKEESEEFINKVREEKKAKNQEDHNAYFISEGFIVE